MILLLVRSGALYRSDLAETLRSEIAGSADLAELRDSTNLPRILARYADLVSGLVELIDQRWFAVVAEPWCRSRQLDASIEIDDALAEALHRLSIWEELLPPLKWSFIDGVRCRDVDCINALRRYMLRDDEFDDPNCTPPQATRRSFPPRKSPRKAGQ